MRAVLFAIALVASLASVSSAAEPTPEGVEWTLVEVGGNPVKLEGKQPFLLLKEGTMNGHSGCNACFGGYDLDGGSLKFGPVGATRMACPEAESAVEQAFFKALDETRAWSVEDGVLVLRNEAGAVVARFEEKAE